MPRLKHSVLAAAAAFAALGLSPAFAEEAPGRYTMTPTDGGFIRLDTQSGAMSLCSGKEGKWACRAMPDDQKMLLGKIAKLEEENRSLREENRRLEDVMGLNDGKPDGGTAPDAPGNAGPPTAPGKGFKLPTEKDLDQAFDYFEGMLKKFQERLKKLEEKNNKDGTVPL